MNEIRLTKEQRAELKRHERHLHTAFYADYVVGLPASDVRALFGIFNKIYSAHETNYSCNFCVLNVCKKLGRLFFKNDKTDNKKK